MHAVFLPWLRSAAVAASLSRKLWRPWKLLQSRGGQVGSQLFSNRLQKHVPKLRRHQCAVYGFCSVGNQRWPDVMHQRLGICAPSPPRKLSKLSWPTHCVKKGRKQVALAQVTVVKCRCGHTHCRQCVDDAAAAARCHCSRGCS